MSEANLQRQANPKAEAVQFSASQWLERRERGNWNDSDEEEFVSWLAASPAHVVAYMRVEDIWNRANRLRALNHPEHNAASAPGRRALFARTAAMFVAIILAGVGGILYMRAPRDAIYTTAIGQHRNVQLADGSRVELNTDTILRLGIQGRTRVATLEKGEAYFDIKHDSKRAFIVRVGGNRVVDLGTQFSIRRDSGRIRVAVFEGRARFDLGETGALSRSTVLVPGDVAIAKSGTVDVARVSPQILGDGIAWRRGELVFHFTSLANAATEFNRYNRKKLSVQGSEIARMQIGGTFELHDVAGFGRQVSRLLGIRADDRGTGIVLSR
ncbi:MAG TPA: FecR domain-containing protein [Rhizomicrobium sp.]|nr:FecR domain-containing protein [Rhizomicrobium sp.]